MADMSQVLESAKVTVNKGDSTRSCLSNLINNLDGLGRIDRLDLTAYSLSEIEEAELSELLIWLFKRIYRKKGNHWFWTGTTDGQGYPRITVGGKTWQAHRLLYELFRKPIRNGMELHHLCGLEKCVRPDHLMQVAPGLNKLLRDLVANPAKLEKLREDARKAEDYIGMAQIWVEGERKSEATKKASSAKASEPAQPVQQNHAIKVAKKKSKTKAEAAIPPDVIEAQRKLDEAVKKLDATEINPKAKQICFYTSWLRSPKRGDLFDRLFYAGIPEHWPSPEHMTTLKFDPGNAEHISLITEVVQARDERRREIRAKKATKAKPQVEQLKK